MSKDRIFDAARAILDHEGIEGLSVRKVAARAGVSTMAMYRHFAEREASFFESIIMPQLRQRNPDARKTAMGSLGDLSRASRKLKQALLRNNLRQHLTSP